MRLILVQVGLDFWCGSILVSMRVDFGFDFGFGFGGPLLSVNSTEVKSVPPLLSQWSIRGRNEHFDNLG